MAEIGVAASITGLVSIGLQTTEYLYKYYTAYKDRNEDLQTITLRLKGLLQYLTVIAEVLQQGQGLSGQGRVLENIETAIYQSQHVIYKLQKEVRRFEKESVTNISTAAKVLGHRFSYPFRKDTLTRLDKTISLFNENLAVAFHALYLKAHQNTQHQIGEVKNVIQGEHAQSLTAEVLRWLKAPDASIEYYEACAKRHASTGQWFMQDATFTRWLQQENSFLWLNGFSGTGKSVLWSTAIQHAFCLKRSQPGIAVAYFFFTFSDKRKRDSSALVRSILLQLSRQIPGLGVDLRKLYDMFRNETPTLPDLMECLRQVLVQHPHVYVILDALDESPIGAVRQGVLATLQMMRNWLLPGLHLLATSRDLPDIRERLKLPGFIQGTESVVLNCKNMQQDIEDYINYQVDFSADLQRWGDHRGKIKAHLIQHANGVFRYVECQLDLLRDCPRSGKYLEKMLRTLPRSLEETYERMLCDIKVGYRDDAQRILALLCCSARPLSITEVIDALAVNLDEEEGFDTDARLKDADSLLKICPGLIKIDRIVRYVEGNGNGNGVDSRLESSDSTQVQDEVVRLGHFSVQEYLVSKDIRQGRAAFYAVGGGREHMLISHTCLLYLRNEDFLVQALTSDLTRQYPFAKYAAEYWYYHCRQGNGEFQGNPSSLPISFLTSSVMLRRWVMLHDPDRPWNNCISYGESDEDQSIASAVYYTSLLGLDKVLPGVLSLSHTDVNARGGLHGTALQAASARGHEKIVQVLLEKGAIIDVEGEYFGTALQTASYRGYEQIVRILLKNSADVNNAGGFYGNALQAASYNGHATIVRILLDEGADINAKGGFCGNALQTASARGQEQIVRMLLDSGADVNVRGGEYGTTLQAASCCGHEKIVQMLLDRGGDVNAAGGGYGTAVKAASDAGHERVVQLLLRHGARRE